MVKIVISLLWLQEIQETFITNVLNMIKQKSIIKKLLKSIKTIIHKILIVQHKLYTTQVICFKFKINLMRQKINIRIVYKSITANLVQIILSLYIPIIIWEKLIKRRKGLMKRKIITNYVLKYKIKIRMNLVRILWIH